MGLNVFEFIVLIIIYASILKCTNSEARLLDVIISGMNLSYVFNCFRDRLPKSIIQMTAQLSPLQAYKRYNSDYIKNLRNPNSSKKFVRDDGKQSQVLLSNSKSSVDK